MKKRVCTVAALAMAISLVAGASALGMAGCAPQESAGDAAKASASEQAGLSFTWTADAECATCHTAEGDSLTNAACEISASHGDLACASCHTDTSGLESAHAEVDMNDYQVPKKLKKTDVSKEACLSCHDQAEVAAATADLTVLTDDNGLTVNPHELPGNSEHDKLVCSKCHTMHEEATPDENAADACASCHHAGVYECHTCHS